MGPVDYFRRARKPSRNHREPVVRPDLEAPEVQTGSLVGPWNQPCPVSNQKKRQHLVQKLTLGIVVKKIFCYFLCYVSSNINSFRSEDPHKTSNSSSKAEGVPEVSNQLQRPPFVG